MPDLVVYSTSKRAFYVTKQLACSKFFWQCSTINGYKVIFKTFAFIIKEVGNHFFTCSTFSLYYHTHIGRCKNVNQLQQFFRGLAFTYNKFLFLSLFSIALFI